MNSKFLLCVLAVIMCPVVQEASAQHHGHASSHYPSAHHGGYGNAHGAYGAHGYGLGSAHAGHYGKREAGSGPSQNNQ